MSRKNDNEELTSCNNLCKNCKFFDFEEKQGVCYLTRKYTLTSADNTCKDFEEPKDWRENEEMFEDYE